MACPVTTLVHGETAQLWCRKTTIFASMLRQSSQALLTQKRRFRLITLTGIPLRPGTAEYYTDATERGYSRDNASGCNVEGIGGLIMDAQNAHVDGDGYYHYHGIPYAVLGALDGKQLKLG